MTEYLNEQFPDRWIGPGGPQNWPPRSPDITPLDFYVWGFMKNIVFERKVYVIEFSMLQDAVMVLMFYVRFRSSRVSNIHSSIAVENRTHGHMTVLTGNGLRNKILKYWREVTGHPANTFGVQCIYYFSTASPIDFWSLGRKLVLYLKQ
jgi:hypothetical protein